MGVKDVAFPAHLHLFLPVGLNLSLADCPVDEPAQLPNAKLPRRAISPVLDGAFPQVPAILSLTLGAQLGQEEQYLPLDMNRYFSPSLLKALYSL